MIEIIFLSILCIVLIAVSLIEWHIIQEWHGHFNRYYRPKKERPLIILGKDGETKQWLELRDRWLRPPQRITVREITSKKLVDNNINTLIPSKNNEESGTDEVD